jgi:hypothetical protein
MAAEGQKYTNEFIRKTRTEDNLGDVQVDGRTILERAFKAFCEHLECIYLV